MVAISRTGGVPAAGITLLGWPLKASAADPQEDKPSRSAGVCFKTTYGRRARAVVFASRLTAGSHVPGEGKGWALA